jgi:adenylate cyclase
MERDLPERKLAAILHADVVSYSRLMGEDEDATHRTLKGHMQAMTELVRAHRGEVATMAGDALLAQFPSVVAAVQCAVEIQALLKKRNADLADDRKLMFRIGINIGDVIFDSDSVYGNGVNVAARLESLAEPGGVFISQSTYEQVRNKLPLDYEYIGAQNVKNIAEPVGVYRVVLEPGPMGVPRPAVPAPSTGTAGSQDRRWRTTITLIAASAMAAVVLWLGYSNRSVFAPVSLVSRATGLPSIAVLPFDNLSDDTEQSYFADGMADDVITDLTKISGLVVIARDSTFAYKGEVPDIQKIAKNLDVRYILHGSVRRIGDQVRINAQLTDAANGSHMWAERYDGAMANIFELQDKVTQNIVRSLSVTLTSGEQLNLSRKDTDNLEAYDLFLRGQEFFFRHSKTDNRKAQELYSKVLQLDPNFARVYAMLAWTEWFEFANGWSDTPEDSLNRARDYALKALARNDALPIAYFVNGLVYRERKAYEQARGEAEKAIALDPNYANARVLLASVLYYTGKAEEGLILMREAQRLNPHYPHNYPFHVGQAYFIMGDYKKAIEVFKEGLNRNPSSQRLRLWLVAAYAQDGQLDNAKWELEQVHVQDPELTLARIKPAYPFKYNADMKNFLDGLRKAGM